MATSYVVGLVSVGAKYKNKIIQAADRVDIDLGDPCLERVGVANRRFCVAHDFSQLQIDKINQFIVNNNETLSVGTFPDFPANWRYPLDL